jgi:hypothetical protein
MVVAYKTLDFESSVKKTGGTIFAATLEAARSLLPGDARRLPFEPEYQFLELWETDGPDVAETGDPDSQ